MNRKVKHVLLVFSIILAAIVLITLLWVAVLSIASRSVILSDSAALILAVLHQLSYVLLFYIALLPSQLVYLMFPGFEENFETGRMVAQTFFSAVVWTPLILAVESKVRGIKYARKKQTSSGQ